MKKYILVFFLLLKPISARPDLWGGDLPLLAQIVANTLNTLMEMRHQSTLLSYELDGITDRINRIRTISEIVKPSEWDQWKNPHEAARRLRTIYHTIPPEYRSEKSDLIEAELSRAMNMIARIVPEAQTTFASGKELEQRGANASPGVAQKLTASGVGTLISMEAQSQIIQSHVVSLLSQMLAEANERETRGIVMKGSSFIGVSENLGPKDGRFSTKVTPLRMER